MSVLHQTSFIVLVEIKYTRAKCMRKENQSAPSENDVYFLVSLIIFTDESIIVQKIFY